MIARIGMEPGPAALRTAPMTYIATGSSHLRLPAALTIRSASRARVPFRLRMQKRYVTPAMVMNRPVLKPETIFFAGMP